MGFVSKTATKVWDGFAKAVGAGFAALLGAAVVWTFGIPTRLQTEPGKIASAPATPTALPKEKFYMSSYIPGTITEGFLGTGTIDEGFVGTAIDEGFVGTGTIDEGYVASDKPAKPRNR